jgi:hypothetical protein
LNCTSRLLEALFLDAPDNNLAEFIMNASSDATWMNAASSGFRNPKAASPTPAASTARVPAKLNSLEWLPKSRGGGLKLR